MEIDQAAWPVMRMRVHGELTLEDVEEMERGFALAFERGGPFVTWMDARDIHQVPAPAIRRAVAEWMNSIEGSMKEHNVGSCNLLRSPIMRGVITAIFWIYTPPVPQGTPSSEEEAIRWCGDRLRENGVDPEASLATLSQLLEPGQASGW